MVDWDTMGWAALVKEGFEKGQTSSNPEVFPWINRYGEETNCGNGET